MPGSIYDDEIEDLLRSATDALRAVLVRAFEDGRDLGRRETEMAVSESVKRLQGIVEGFQGAFRLPPASVGLETRSPDTMDRRGRAEPGSIRPRILGALQVHGPAKPSDIFSMTGIKENTIRGTLRSLAAENKVFKDDDGKWSVPTEYRSEPSADELRELKFSKQMRGT